MLRSYGLGSDSRSGWDGATRCIEGNRRTWPDEASLRRPDRRQLEHGSIERVQAGRHDPDPAQPEDKHGILGVAGMVGHDARRLDRREVRLAAERRVQCPERRAGRRAVGPGVLEPALANFGVRPAGDPPLDPIAASGRSDVAEVAVVAERESARRIGEGLGVGQLQGRELRRPAEVDEEARRLSAADVSPSRVVAEGPDVTMAIERRVGSEPRGAPAEARQPEPLEALGERPEVVDPEGLAGPGNEVLAHGGDDTRGVAR